VKEPVEAASMPNTNSPLFLTEPVDDYDFNLTEVGSNSDMDNKEESEPIDMAVEEHPEIKEEKP